MNSLAIKMVLWSLVLIFSTFLTLRAWGYTGRDCIRCHKEGSLESKLHVDINTYIASVHGRELRCLDCHQRVKDNRHTIIKDSGKVDCQECHEQRELHSKDGTVACHSCHTRHHIYHLEDSRSSVYWKNLKETCGKCHPKQSGKIGILSFLPSFCIASHPKQSFGKIFDKSMCVGCHQGQAAHGESFPINNQNCYKCHMPLGQKDYLLGYIHLDADWRNQPVNFVAGYIYLITLVVFIVVLINRIMGFVRKRQ